MFTSSGPKSEIDKYAEASSVSSDTSNPQELNIDLKDWNLLASWSEGTLNIESIAADSYEEVILENSTNLSVGKVPSYLLPNRIVAATPN